MPTTAVHRREGKGRGRERGRKREGEGGREGSNYLHVMPRLWDSW